MTVPTFYVLYNYTFFEMNPTSYKIHCTFDCHKFVFSTNSSKNNILSSNINNQVFSFQISHLFSLKHLKVRKLLEKVSSILCTCRGSNKNIKFFVVEFTVIYENVLLYFISAKHAFENMNCEL